MRVFSAFLLSSVALFLSACAGMPVPTISNSDSAPGTVLRGSVHGGQNPIVGAHVYLYAINNAGYGGPGIAPSSTNASVSLLQSAANTTEDGNGKYYVTTDPSGNFTITNDYSCPSSYAHTYFYATGGDPGLGSGVNSAITLTAPADACNTSASTDINEVSTVVTAYVFAGYESDPLHISSSNTALASTGLTNAANTLANLEDVNLSVALATTPAGNGTVPQQEINTLANILAACVNSAGPTSTPCSTLFSSATNNGVNAPDTATAVLNIAHNPGLSPTAIANVFGLQTATSPFQPSLPSTPTPNDFTIAISYSGAGMNGPLPVAIDKAGNVWVGNTTTGANSVSELNPVGAPITTSAGYTGGGIEDPFSIAIDKSGNVWTANVTPNSLSEISNTGTPATLSPYTGGGLNAPYSIAFDLLGHAWVVNNVGASLSEFSSAGTAITTSPGDQGGGINNDPVSLAIDALGNIWVTDSITLGALSEFYSSGTSAGMPITGSTGYTGGGLADPWGIAIDANGNVWVADSSSSTSRLSLFALGGTAISSSTGYTGGGLNVPEGIAVDGAGNVWVANRGSTATSAPYPDSSISEFNSVGVAISPSTGYQAGLNISLSLAIDGSGNVWTTNSNLNTVTEFVGAASPVVTPIVANLLFPYGSRAVNRP
jgi:streptogramin lyase